MNLAKTFTYGAFNSIPCNSRLDISLGNGQAQACIFKFVLSAEQGQVFIPGLTWTGEDPLKLGRLQQPFLPGKRPGKHELARLRRRGVYGLWRDEH